MKFKYTWNDLQLKYKLIFSVTLVHVLLMTVFGVFVVVDHLAFINKQTRSDLINHAEILSEMIKPWIQSEDLMGLSEVVKTLTRTNIDLNYIVFFDTNGKIVGHSNEAWVGRYLSDPRVLTLLTTTQGVKIITSSSQTMDVLAPVNYANQIIGWVLLSQKMQEVNREKNRIMIVSGLSILIALVLGVLLAFLLSRQISIRLHRFLAVIQKISAGDRSMRTALAGKDEVGELSTYFDLMLAQLNNEEEKVAIANEELEANVIQRTAHLEQALLEVNDLKSLLETLITQTPIGLFSCKQSGACIIANETVAQISGASRETMLQINFRELPPWKENGLFDIAERVLQTGNEEVSERWVTTSFGLKKCLKYRFSRFVEKGEPHFLMIVEDVTRVNEAQRKLIENEAMLQQIIDNFPGMVFLKDTQNKYLIVNRYMAEAYQQPQETLAGTSLFDLHSAEDAQGYYDADLIVINSGVPKLNIEEEWETTSGTKTLLTSKIPVLDVAGNVDKVLGISLDITELKKYMNALEESNQKLDDFAYIASHDLKEPIRAISNFASFLKEDYADKLDNEGLRFIDVISQQTHRVTDQIDALLRFARIGRKDLHLEAIDVNSLLYDLAGIFQTNYPGVKFVIQPDFPMQTADPSFIAEIFTNLISNGIKYNTQAEKIIEIGYHKKNTDPIWYVRDNGIGIDEEHFQDIFKIFRRLHARDDYQGGTGAGLTITKKLVESHHGKIWLESVPGKGTTFYFYLGGQ